MRDEASTGCSAKLFAPDRPCSNATDAQQKRRADLKHEMTSLISSHKLEEIQGVNQPLMKITSDSHQFGGCRVQQFSF